MPQSIIPQGSVVISDLPYERFFLQCPPVVIPTVAPQLNSDPDASVDATFHPSTGTIHSSAVPTLTDTYSVGSSGYTAGTTWNITANTHAYLWKNGIQHLSYQNFGLQYVSSDEDAPSDTVSGEIISANTFPVVPNDVIEIKRGSPAFSIISNLSTRSAAVFYTYIEIGYQSDDGSSFRINMSYGDPLSLDYQNGDGKWKLGVAKASKIPNLERYLSANDRDIVFKLIPKLTPPDPATGKAQPQQLDIEVGGDHLTFTPPNAQPLPTNGYIKINCKNAWNQVWYLQQAYRPISVTTPVRDLGYTHSGFSNAFVATNGLANSAPPGQQDNYNVIGDGRKVQIQGTSSQPDGGSGLGSTQPSAIADYRLIIPAVWTNTASSTDVVSLPNPRVVSLNARYLELHSVWDDLTCTTYTSGNVTMDLPRDGSFASIYGNYAVEISVAGGDSNFKPIFVGMAGAGPEGYVLSRNDPERRMTMPIVDFSYVLQTVCPDELMGDGMELGNYVNLVCQSCGIHPQFLAPNLKTYVPQGCTSDSPFAPADETLPPGSIALGRGTGLSPKFRTMGISGWEILKNIVLDQVALSPNTGFPVPYYMGFDPQGIFHFEPVDFSEQPIQWIFSDQDPSGTGKILGRLTASNSTASMRTVVDLQGLSTDFELLVAHQNSPIGALQSVGYRYPYFERSIRFPSQDYITAAAQAMAFAASLPQQVIKFQCSYIPNLAVGMVISVTEGPTLGGTYSYVIKSIDTRFGYSVEGNGKAISLSTVTARSLINAIAG